MTSSNSAPVYSFLHLLVLASSRFYIDSHLKGSYAEKDVVNNKKVRDRGASVPNQKYYSQADSSSRASNSR